MDRLAARAQRVLILLALLFAAGAPAFIKGYAELSLAQMASEHQDYSAAAAAYEAAARLLPWKPELWEQAALAQVADGNSDRAEALFSAARRRGALSETGWQNFGLIHWRHGNYQEALDIWSAGLKQYPAALEFYSTSALAYRSMHNYGAEREALEIWLASGGGSARENYELGLLLMASQPERAIQEFERASSTDPALGPAVETLRSAMSLAARAPDDSSRLVILGRALGLVNEWPLAQQAFEEAVQANSQNPEAWAWLGEAGQHNGNSGQQELDMALSLDAANTVVRALRGLYWKRQNQYSSELGEYMKAAQIQPDNPEWQAALGGAYNSIGDLVSALGSYQKATELAPANSTYWRLLAAFCADNAVHVLDVGLPAARKAAQIAPADPQVLDTLGWSFVQAGLLHNAEETLLKATSLVPGLALPHLHLAETYLRKGDQTSALHELNMARQLDPEGPVGEYAGRLIDQYFP